MVAMSPKPVSKTDLTRAPKAPPFAVGTKLRCVTKRGDVYTASAWNDQPSPRDIKEHPEDWTKVFGVGLEVVIDEVIRGTRGTGKQLRDEDGPMIYDDGDPILDDTKNGLSVYHVTSANGHRDGRLIRHENRSEWEVIK